MYNIKISVPCPDCGEDIIAPLYMADNSPISISIFEQEEWRCDQCNKTFYSGDFELLSEDEI